jgi:hypothetical protein
MTDLLTELEALVITWETGSPLVEGHAQRIADAMALRSLIAAEKARGPDPLLVQAREALRRIIGWSEQMKALRELCAKPDAWLDAFVRDVSMAETVIAALDARLGGKA